MSSAIERRKPKSRPAPAEQPSLERVRTIIASGKSAATSAGRFNAPALSSEPAPGRAPRQAVSTDVRIKVAGFGGQGVLMLGQVMAEAGLDAGLNVSWLPSYGPEMRSGTSNCHVRISSEEIDSPLVSRPNVLLALNEPSLHKFLASVEPGGWVLYNGIELPEDARRSDVRFIVQPFTALGDKVGDVRVGNIVMLGALLEATNSSNRSASTARYNAWCATNAGSSSTVWRSKPAARPPAAQ